jgi:hypothetical protein
MLYFSNTKTYSPFCGQPKKNAMLSFYDLGLRVGPRPSRQTTKPYSFAELPGRKEERKGRVKAYSHIREAGPETERIVRTGAD